MRRGAWDQVLQLSPSGDTSHRYASCRNPDVAPPSNGPKDWTGDRSTLSHQTGMGWDVGREGRQDNTSSPYNGKEQLVGCQT